MIIEEPLPHELKDILNSPEFDDEAGILIESIQFLGKDLYLTFSIRFDGDTGDQSWQVKIQDVQNEKIIRNWT